MKQIDWSKHELKIVNNEFIQQFELKILDSITHRVCFTNVDNRMLVTGDFGNWVCSRRFYPTDDLFIGYFKEKFQYLSTQTFSEFDGKETYLEIQRLLTEEEDLTIDEIEYLENISTEVYDEISYKYHAYITNVGRFEEYGNIPYVREENFWFNYIHQAFCEIGKRLKLDSKTS
jgi:hypothetical protein